MKWYLLFLNFKFGRCENEKIVPLANFYRWKMLNLQQKFDNAVEEGRRVHNEEIEKYKEEMEKVKKEYVKCVEVNDLSREIRQLEQEVRGKFDKERLMMLKMIEEKKSKVYTFGNCEPYYVHERKMYELKEKIEMEFVIGWPYYTVIFDAIREYNKRVVGTVFNAQFELAIKTLGDYRPKFEKVRDKLHKIKSTIKEKDEKMELVTKDEVEEWEKLSQEMHQLEEKKEEVRDYCDEVLNNTWNQLSCKDCPQFVQRVKEIFNPEDPNGPGGLEQLGDYLIGIHQHNMTNTSEIFRGDMSETAYENFTLNNFHGYCIQ